MLDGKSWVMKMAVSSSTGSIQNAVLAAPPQANSPTEQMLPFIAGSSTTEKPSPNPMPSMETSEKSDCPSSFSSLPPGRWLVAMYSRVRRPMTGVPSGAAPCASSMEANFW